MSIAAKSLDSVPEEDPRPEPTPIRLVRLVDVALAKLEEIGLAAALAILIGIGVMNALMRNFFPPPPTWTDEVIRYSVFFIGLLGGALATASDRLVNIDMLTRLFSMRGKLVVRILTASFTMTMCGLLIRSGIFLYTNLLDETGEVIDPATGALMIPVAALLIGLHTAVHAVIDIFYLVSGRTPDYLGDATPTH